MRCHLFSALVLCGLAAAQPADAAMNDEPILLFVNAHQLEWRKDGAQDALVWELESWLGTTRERLAFRSEGEVNEVETDEFETILVYSRPVSAFWNINMGWRGDWQPATRRSWATVELEGLAPGFVESRFSLLAGPSGRFAARVELETEWLLSRYWELKPRAELDWYSDDDPANELASGTTALELGLRLGYRLRRDFKPYIGVEWTGLLGDTDSLARAAGRARRSTQVLAGLSFWF